MRENTVTYPDIWDVLTSGTTLSCPIRVAESIHQFQLWLLRLLSAPAPIPGCTCVYLSFQPPTVSSPLCFAVPDQSRLPLVDFPVTLPFEIMGIRKALRLIMCLLLEQKVVLQSSDYNKLSLTILSLVALLYPLQYMFPVIPLLPACMPDAEQLLLAPTPYLIGVPTAFYTARKIFRMPKDVWLADLDTRELSYPMVVDEIPELPEIESNILISHLNKLLHEFSNSPHMDLDLSDSSKHWSPSIARATALELSKFDPLLYTLTKDSVDVAIRVCMILFFNTKNILGGFTNHIRTLRLFPRPVVAFQYESFMKSRPKPCLFTSMLAKTQAVEYFAESSISAYNESYQRIYSGVYAPNLIGDKLAWYKNQLKVITFNCWDKLIDFAHVIVEPNHSSNHQLSTCCNTDQSRLLLLYQAVELIHSTKNRRAHTTTTDDVDGDDDDMCMEEIDKDSGNDFSEYDDQMMNDFNVMFKTYSDDSDSIYSPDTVISDCQLSNQMKDCILAQANQPLPDCFIEFYTPPKKFVHTNESNVCRSVSSEIADSKLSNIESQLSDANGKIKKNINEQLMNANSNTGLQSFTVSTNSTSGTLTRSSSVSSKHSINDTLHLVSRLSSSIFTNNSNNNINNSNNNNNNVSKRNSDDDNLGWDSSVTLLFGDLLKSNRLRSLTFKDVPLSAMQIHKKRLENERTIIDLSKSIKQGRIPNIFSRNHINTLLQDENYRNLLMARINENLAKNVLPNQPHIDNVPIQQWDQYKAILWTLKQMINGLEYSFRPDILFPTTNQYDRLNRRDQSPLSSTAPNSLTNNTTSNTTSTSWLTYSTGMLKTGGLASAFMLMEIAHTHYYRLPNRTNNHAMNNNQNESFLWNSMPTTPTTEVRSPLMSTRINANNGYASSVRYTNDRLDLSDCESYNGSRTKLDLLPGHGSSHQFTNVIVTMSEPSSDKEEQDNGRIQSSHLFKSDSVDLMKQNVQLFNHTNINNNNNSNNKNTLNTINTTYKKFEKLSTSDTKLHESSINKMKQLARDNHDDDDDDERRLPTDCIPELPIRKSQRSFGYRYYHSYLILTDPSIISNATDHSIHEEDTTNCLIYNSTALHNSTTTTVTTTPPAIYCPNIKFHFNQSQSDHENDENVDYYHDHDQHQQPQQPEQQVPPVEQPSQNMCQLTLLTPTPSPPIATSTSSSSPLSSSSSSSLSANRSTMNKIVPWTYLFEDIFNVDLQKFKILNNLQFWEDCFLDTVAQERDILGMDFRPKDLLYKYHNASSLLKRKQMELEEDCLLVNIMHNMIAFMLMSNVNRTLIRKKLQRLLAKSHTGLHYSKKINDLLNSLDYLNGNDIELNVAQSRFIVQRSHEAYRGSDDSGELIFLEVCSDYLLIRNLSGRILERLWYDEVINLTYRSNAHVLCITRQIVDHSQMDLFYTRKVSTLLYWSVMMMF
ncbi:unnamed protein product [Schistosoma turkestanicum]|nr:unnamed protein product [Schistosoma turkestanicum]